MPLDAVFSFVVDTDPRFAQNGFHLARSLFDHTRDLRVRVLAQVTPEVPVSIRDMFASIGCEVRQFDRFGDGRYCNKLGQFEALQEFDYRYAVLMDTDMLALSDLGPLLAGDAPKGRIVGLSNPSLSALSAVAAGAGAPAPSWLTPVDCADEETFFGNLNGGLYVLPRAFVGPLARSWRRWTLWLLENDGVLRAEGKRHHCDQVGFWLAMLHGRLRCELLPANWNFNPGQAHRSYDPALPIAVLHYHRLDADDRISPVSREPNCSSIAAANAYFEACADEWRGWSRRL